MKKYVDMKWEKAGDAVAYQINFHNIFYTYDDVPIDYYYSRPTLDCWYGGEQIKDFEMPKGNIRKEYGQLDSGCFAVVDKIRDLLIGRFADITESDFRPVWTKKHDIPVCWQITPRTIMKPIYELNSWEVEVCEKCGHIQYWYNGIEENIFCISEEILGELHGLNRTYETYRNNYDVVVRKDVYEFLSDMYPRMQFKPVFLRKCT